MNYSKEFSRIIRIFGPKFAFNSNVFDSIRALFSYLFSRTFIESTKVNINFFGRLNHPETLKASRL